MAGIESNIDSLGTLHLQLPSGDAVSIKKAWAIELDRFLGKVQGVLNA